MCRRPHPVRNRVVSTGDGPLLSYRESKIWRFSRPTFHQSYSATEEVSKLLIRDFTSSWDHLLLKPHSFHFWCLASTSWCDEQHSAEENTILESKSFIFVGYALLHFRLYSKKVWNYRISKSSISHLILVQRLGGKEYDRFGMEFNILRT